MKLYTLEYDCNSPVAQQINVPTNTDYKVGVKFVKDGQIQNLTPDSVTLGTLSADSDKTNGYVTFTLSADDNTSYKQLNVKVDVQAYNEEYRKVEQFGSTTPNPNPSYTRLYASDLRIAGMEIKASDFANACVYTWRKTTQPPETGTEGWTERPLIQRTGVSILKTYYFAESTAMGDVAWGVCRADDYLTLDENNAVPELVGFTFKAGNYYFFKGEIVPYYGVKFMEVDNTHTFAPDDLVVYNGALKFTANYWWGKQFIWSFGTPFSADFKLNTNVFKSQQGDICEIGNRANTVSSAGTLSDSTPFDYNVVIK